MSAATDPVSLVRSVAESLGVACGSARQIYSGANTVVDLVSVPVVARVLTVTAEYRGSEAAHACAERDVALVTHLQGRDLPVVAPSDLLPPGPHRQGGLTLSFWKRVDHSPERTPDPETEGQALQRIHHALESFEGELGGLTPIDELPGVIDKLVQGRRLDADSARRLQDDLLIEARAIDASALPQQPVHGDAHLNNVLRTPSESIWGDFDDSGVGSVAWDLACLVASRRAWGGALSQEAEAAFEAYGERPGDAELKPFLRARLLQGIAWGLAVAGDAAAEQAARQRLDWWFDGGRDHFAR